jgi:DNA-binding PadR family transcriptional regulator
MLGDHNRGRHHQRHREMGSQPRHRRPGPGPGALTRLAMFGRGQQVRRGDVRQALLMLLAESPMHGYQMITELTERSAGAWRPSAGSVYPTLQQLEDEGLVRVEEQDDRRVYQLTDAGRELTSRSERVSPPWEIAGPDGSPDLRRVGVQVMSAAMQVMRDGDPRMRADAYALLADCRRSLYRLLAEDDPHR